MNSQKITTTDLIMATWSIMAATDRKAASVSLYAAFAALHADPLKRSERPIDVKKRHLIIVFGLQAYDPDRAAIRHVALTSNTTAVCLIEVLLAEDQRIIGEPADARLRQLHKVRIR